MTVPYEYEPFQKDGEIRIVRVLAGWPGQPLECRLVPVLIQGNTVAYEALSYVWGDSKQDHSMLCDGRSIGITKALHRVLHHLRKTDTIRDLWVDQLCINQRDDLERSQQVLRMADIYKGAEQVIIWLGEESRNVDAAFKLAAGIGSMLAEIGVDHAFNNDELREHGLPTHRGKEFDALGAVLQLPWFSRAWVVQEICMAKSAVIVCGPFSMPWSEFALPVSSIGYSGSRRMGGLYTYNGSPAERIGQVWSWQHLRTHHDRKADLFKILSYIKNCEATDPRDKLFAFTNLTELNIRPDYSLPASSAYTSFARDFIKPALRGDQTTWSDQECWQSAHRAISGFLCNAGKLYHHLDLPSWVPDWSYRQNCRPLWTSKRGEHSLELAYSAGGDIMGECSLDGTRLTISVVLLGTVTQAGHVDLSHARDWPEKQLQGQCLQWWNECAAMHMLTRDPYVTGEARIDALKQTLVAGVNYENKKAPCEFTIDSHHQFQHYVHQDWNFFLVPKSTISARNERSSWPVVSSILGRVFFFTQRGHMGLAPYGGQHGDEVAIMLGCDIPLMLRRVGHGLHGPEYHLLGECFLHGVMFGEVIQDLRLPVASVVLR